MRPFPLAALLPPLLAPASPAQDGPPPADMRGLVHREDAALEGYTFIAPLTSDELLLVDMAGEIAHGWTPTTQTESAMLLEDGHVLRWGILETDDLRFQGPGVGGGIIEKMTWEGEVVWRYELASDDELLHHDIALLPNGNVLALAWEYRSRDEAIAAGRDPAQVDERGIWPDKIVEIRPTPPAGGEVVWTWRAWDHLVQDFDESKANCGAIPDHPGRIDLNADHRGQPPLTAAEIEEMKKVEAEMAALGYGGGDDEEEETAAPRRGSAPDWLHTNAIDYLPEHDLIVLSTPKLNELWVLDHSTTTAQAAGSTGGRWGRGGELLWRWGNPRNYGAGRASDQKLSFQHDPTWLPTDDPNELRLLVFNNGQEWGESAVLELALPFDPERGFPRDAGAAFGPAEPVWSYRDPGTFFSAFISGAQRLPNGNTLICSGAQGRVFEVDAEGRVVWDFRNSYTGEIDHGVPVNSLYRAVRVPKDHPGLAGKGL